MDKSPKKQSKKGCPHYQTPSPRRKIFIDKYLELGNATQAAAAAGYSKRTASHQGSRLLNNPEIKEEIRKRQEKMAKGRIASAQEVMEYFTRVMNGEEKDQFGLEAPLGERTKAAQELAKRTVDIDNRMAGKADATVKITLDWSR